MSRRFHRLVVALMISSIVALASDVNALATTTIAKFAPNSYGPYFDTGFPFNPVFSTGDSTFVARMVSDHRMTIQRIERGGRRTTVAAVYVDPASDGAVEWKESSSIVVASTWSVEIYAQDMPAFISHRRLLAGQRDQPLISLDKCTLGRFSVSGTRIAELSRPCGKIGPLVIKVFELRGESFKRIASTSLPGEFANLAPKEFDPIGPIDFNDRLAILQHGGEAVVFSWRSGQLARRISLSSGNRVIAASFNRHNDVVIVERSDFGDVFVKTYPRTSDDGVTTVALGRASLLRQLDEKLLFTLTDGTPSGYPAIFSIDVNNGANSYFGVFPSWTASQNNALRRAGDFVGSKRIVWAARGCYWEKVSSKPIAAPVTVPADDCPVSFIKGSASLRRRQISVVVTSPRGFSHARGWVSWGERHGISISVQGPKGRRKLSFPVTARQAAYLRKHPGTVLTFLIERENLDDVTYSGVLRR